MRVRLLGVRLPAGRAGMRSAGAVEFARTGCGGDGRVAMILRGEEGAVGAGGMLVIGLRAGWLEMLLALGNAV